jgi:hypothetical protein
VIDRLVPTVRKYGACKRYGGKFVPICLSMAVSLACDLREAIMIKIRVCSDVVMKTAYMSFAAASLVFVLMLLLTGLHP